MARRGDQAARDSLVEFSGPSYAYRSRVNALQALQRLNYLDRTAAGNLLEAATYWNNRLRAPARVVLDYFLGQHSHRETLEEEIRSRSWEPHQEKILQGLLF
jgi:alpha-ketoglutarate-dependent taurine dioxygenase